MIVKTIKPARVIFADKKHEEIYFNLNKSDRLKKAIAKAIKNIKSNAFYGEPISKKLIPKGYISKYKITNLWWIALTKEARLVYSITTPNEVEILAVIIDVFPNHKKYDRKFRY